MRKFISLLIVLTVLCSLCSCSEASPEITSDVTSEVDDGSIKLTESNYTKYISVKEKCYAQGNYECTDDFGKKASLKWCDEIYASVTLEGLSSNFNYNDIKIVYKVTGSYERFSKRPYELLKSLDLGRGQIQLDDYTMIGENFEFEVEVDLDICGNGNSSATYKIPDGYRTNGSDLKNYKIKVVSISGTVTPA